MNLILAGVWLVVAGVFFFIPQDEMAGRLGALGQNAKLAGCVALLLCLYNVGRWWTSRSWVVQQRAIREVTERRRHEAEQLTRQERPMDPNFDFTDRPPS
jgi:hypothetical protein